MSASSIPAWARARGPAVDAPVDTAGSRVPGRALAEPAQVHRRLPEIARPFRRGDDHGHAPVRDQAAIEQVKRLHDPPGGVVVLERDRLPHLRARVHLCPFALSDGDRAELVVRGPEQVHVPAQGEGVHRVGWPVVAVGEAQAGAFFGYISFGWIADRIGRRTAFTIFMVAATIVVPIFAFGARSTITLLTIGPLVGFFCHGYFSMFGAMLAELFPTHIRATAQGFCYNAGRLASAVATYGVGSAAKTYGLGTAIAIDAQDNPWVINFGPVNASTVSKFSTAGVPLISSPFACDTQCFFPAFDAAQNLWISGSDRATVLRPEGSVLKKFATTTFDSGIAINSAGTDAVAARTSN